MERKEVVCKKCNTGGLFWRQSAKGKWYLCAPKQIDTSYDTQKWIPFAHKCPMTYDEQGNRVIAVQIHPDEWKRIMEEHNKAKEEKMEKMRKEFEANEEGE